MSDKTVKVIDREKIMEKIIDYGIFRFLDKYKIDEDIIESCTDDFSDENKKLSWYFISMHQTLSEEFIERWADELDWKSICTYQKLSESFIEKMIDKIKWYEVSKYQVLSEDFIEKWQSRVVWKCISGHQRLSDYFLKKFKHKINWHDYSAHNYVDDNFLNVWKKDIVWRFLHENPNMTPQLLLKYYGEIDNSYLFYEVDFLEEDLARWWGNLDQEGMENVFKQVKGLSFDFLLEHCDDVESYDFIEKKVIPVKFLNKLGNQLSEKAWSKISKYQPLSKRFIIKWINKIDFDMLMINNKINQNIKEDESLELFKTTKKLIQ